MLLCFWYVLLAQLRTRFFSWFPEIHLTIQSREAMRAEVWPAHLCSAEAIGVFHKQPLSPFFSVLGLCLCVPGPSQWAAIPWKSLLLAWDRVAVGSTSLHLPNCLAFSIDCIQLVISHCRREVSWQSLQTDLQARLKVFASTPDSHMKYTSLGSLD